ncbi:MAG: amidohydrolase family protein [Deltaproteobacteria bacterium]|nr:amidohydrolase family protein [Deltaproteobacteria bacterium]
MNIREDWLSLTQEDVIDPKMEICDPHHHLWYDVEIEYSINDLLNDINYGHRVVKTVFVESRLMLRKSGPLEMRPLGETEYIQRVLSQLSGNQNIDISAAIVGFADLTLGSSVERLLEAHISAGKGRFRGIRHTCAWDRSPEFKSRWEVPEGLLSDSKFREGFGCLQKFDLSFDAWLFHPQLAELEYLARKYPDIRIIINHTGGPLGIGPYAERREEVLSNWKRGIGELSKYPNVFIKLGGLGMPICGFGWHERSVPPNSSDLAEIMAPYYLWCIECFGIDRCMFESNFPVDKSSYSYTVLWNAFKRVVEDFSFQERCALFHGTAMDAYRI